MRQLPQPYSPAFEFIFWFAVLGLAMRQLAKLLAQKAAEINKQQKKGFLDASIVKADELMPAIMAATACLSLLCYLFLDD